MRRIALIIIAVVVMLGATGAGGGAFAAQTDSSAAPQPVVVTFASADGSTFRTVLEQPADIAAVESALAGDGYAGIPNGVLPSGDGGVNAPHDWHMQETALADITIEVCDGTATMVDDDVVYWVETVGRFCPWSATVVAVEPLDGSDPDDGFTLPPPPGSVGEVDEYRDEVRQLIAVLIAQLLAILGEP